MSTEISKIKEAMTVANHVSSTFCLAKWHHVTIYLQTGETHSCYHPAPHKIPLKEVLSNPSALHNTQKKKQERAEMLCGERPGGCQYCWSVEDLGSDYISDRHIRNESIYTPERLREILDNKWDFNINPEYVELSFGNECNFKCGYCHPKASSRYHQEIRQYGPYPVKNHSLNIGHLKTFQEDTNPYVEAWWKWWPNLSKSLSILRITGGEPLMHKSTWELLDDLKRNPRPNLELNLNTNLGGPSAWVNKLSLLVTGLLERKSIKTFKLFSSVDTWGPRAEYIRTGLKLDLWERNLDMYIRQTGSRITLMITFNVLSVTSFTELLKKILEWRKTYNDCIPERGLERKIRFDTPHLKEPLQYDINILPKDEFVPYMHRALEFMQENTNEEDPTMFSELEFERFRRVVKYMETSAYPEELLSEGRRDFYHWFNEYDRRRNVNFLETFPEYRDFYHLCESYV